MALIATNVAQSVRAMRTLHERLKWITETDEISTDELGRRSGVTGQGIRRLIAESKKGNSPGRAQTLRKIAEGNNVSREWLETGEGEPRPDSLTQLERVLGERSWGDAAVAAARALTLRDSSAAPPVYRTAPQWRRFLLAVEEASDTPIPDTGVRVRSTPPGNP